MNLKEEGKSTIAWVPFIPKSLGTLFHLIFIYESGGFGPVLQKRKLSSMKFSNSLTHLDKWQNWDSNPSLFETRVHFLVTMLFLIQLI